MTWRRRTISETQKKSRWLSLKLEQYLKVDLSCVEAEWNHVDRQQKAASFQRKVFDVLQEALRTIPED